MAGKGTKGPKAVAPAAKLGKRTLYREVLTLASGEEEYHYFPRKAEAIAFGRCASRSPRDDLRAVRVELVTYQDIAAFPLKRRSA